MESKYTKVLFGDEAIEKLMEGVDLVCNATAITLGPRGRNVAIDKGYEAVVLHDGVSVSESVKPRDAYLALGAKIIQEAARKQRDAVGDGTTAVMVLAQAILKEGFKAAITGTNVMGLRSEIEAASDKVVAAIEKLSQPVKTLEQKIQVATISAENADLGKLVAETIDKIGDEGIITVEESKQADSFVEMQEGMQIDKGYVHPFMVTEAERMTCVLEDAAILVTDIPLNNIADIGKFLEKEVLPNTKKLLFISPEVGGDFLVVLLGAKRAGQFLPLAIKAPGVGQNQVDILQDIAALTGAKFISRDAGHKFDEMTYADLGHANKVISTKISTIITGGAGHKDDVLSRIAAIKKQGEDETLSEWEKQKLRERYGKLTNGIAVIKIGGQTEVEMNERKERAIDAVAATQAAVQHGIVPGGEIVYLTASDSIKDDQSLGAKILLEALRRPFSKLLENGGYKPDEKYAQLRSTLIVNENFGFDVTDGTFKDMLEAGIIDPTLVPTSAIKSAVSVAIQILTSGAIVVGDDPEVSSMQSKPSR